MHEYLRYSSAIRYLYGLQRFGIKLGLQNISRLLDALGNPQQRLNCIHVAGTNGKGSTCAMIEAILRESGYRPGLYTSPHLVDFTERIQIVRKPIPRSRVAELTAMIKRQCGRKSMQAVTFFEFVTAMAFLYFEEEKADPVVVETGLGGRFDATNVIQPLLSIITTIGLEHQQYLGTSLSEIAREKAGIIKRSAPVVSGARQTEADTIIRSACAAASAPLYRLGRDIRLRRGSHPFFSYSGINRKLSRLRCGLAGRHQQENAALAIGAAEVLERRGYAVREEDMRDGIEKAFWPCRFEAVQHEPEVVLDGAHNPEGCRVLVKTLDEEYGPRRRIMVVGMMHDKDIPAMLKILTAGAYATIVCRPVMDRSAGREEFEKYVDFRGCANIFWRERSRDALKFALDIASENDVVCVAGSLFLAGEIRELYAGQGKGAGRVGM